MGKKFPDWNRIPPLFLHYEFVCCSVNLVGLGAFEQIERVDLHVDELGVIEGFILLLTVFGPENDNTVLHLPAGHYLVHILSMGNRR